MKLGSSAADLVGSDLEFPEFDPLVSASTSVLLIKDLVGRP